MWLAQTNNTTLILPLARNVARVYVYLHDDNVFNLLIQLFYPNLFAFYVNLSEWTSLYGDLFQFIESYARV